MIDQIRQFESDAMRNNMVNFHEGRLWFAPHVIDDIESFTGRRFETESPREFAEFVRSECFKLQNVMGDGAVLQHAFQGFAMLKLLQYLVEHKMHGQEFVGEAPLMPELMEQFRCEPAMVLQGPVLH